MPSCGVGADGGGGRRTDHAVTGTITVTVNNPDACPPEPRVNVEFGICVRPPVDGIVGHGDAATIAAKAREHLAAGADHVMVMVIGTDFADGVDQREPGLA
jgi:hypothetical protein